MKRRELLAMLSASAVLSGTFATPVMATARGSNMEKFVKRQAAKQMEKRKRKEKIEKDNTKPKEDQKSDE